MNPNSSEAQTEKNGKRSKKHDLFLVLAVLAGAGLPLSQSAWTGQSL